MTLLRQFSLLLICLFCLLFIGATTVTVTTTRSHLDRQLQDLADHAASSLATSLAEGADLSQPRLERDADLIFGTGQFQEVAIKDPDGKVLVQRILQKTVEDVPSWFVGIFPILPQRASAVVLRGPQQTDTVSVVATTNSARRIVWDTGIKSLLWFSAVLLVVLIFSVFLVHRILLPLRRVEAQAQAISKGEYPTQQVLPRTLELRNVVVAINRLSGKIRQMVDSQAEAMSRLRDETYRDPVTGIANRRYFDLQLQQLMASSEEFHTGALILIELKNFKALNEERGYQAADDLLRTAAQVFKEHIEATGAADYFIVRMAGANFAVVLSNLSERDAMEVGDRLSLGLKQLRQRGLADADDVGHIGLAMFRRQSLTQFLAEADSAMRTAQNKGPNALHMHTAHHSIKNNAVAGLSATGWSEFLRNVIEKKNIILHLQPVLHCGEDRSLQQYETLLRVVGDDGQLVAAAIFVPMAKRLGLIQQIDRLVISEVLARIRQDRYGQTRVAINLFPATLQDPEFGVWLCSTLRADPAAAKRIAFEVPEYGALENLEVLRWLVGQVRKLGAQFGVDHVGRGFSSFGYLSSLKLDYLKIDGSFIRGIQGNRDNQFLVESICKIAHGLDLQVIAEAVETDKEWATLMTLGVDGVQGYGVGMPAEI